MWYTGGITDPEDNAVREYADEGKVMEALARRVGEEYDGVPRLTPCRRLRGGERNDVFLMEGGGEKKIVRVIHHATDVRGLRFTNDWSRFAAERMPEVSAPYLTRSGETFFVCDGMMAGLYPYMEGEPSRRDYLPHRLDMARKHAQLHRIGVEYPVKTPRPDRQTMLDLDLENNFLFRWSEVTAMLADGGRALFEDPRHQNEEDQRCIEGLYRHRQSLIDARRELEEWQRSVRARKSGLLYAAMHGDLYPSNVLAVGDRITGIIDWDECNVDCLAYEFGRGMWEYTKDLDTFCFDPQAVRQYADAYAEAGGPVPPEEWDIIVPSIRLLKFTDTVFYMQNAIIGDVWGPAYGYESVRVLENLRDFRLFG